MFNTFSELRKHIKTSDWNKLQSWKTSKTQSYFHDIGYSPDQTIEYFQKMLKGKHMGTLTDVLTANITRPSYHNNKDIPHCLYCKHVRKTHKNYVLSNEHLTKCTLNKHARAITQQKIIQKAQEQWEPEWNYFEQFSEAETKLARQLVNQLQVPRREKG